MRSLRIVGGLAVVVMTLTILLTTANASQAVVHRAWLRSDSPAPASATGSASRGSVSKSLALVVLLAGGGYFTWRKLNKKVTPSVASSPHVRVLSGTVVGPKARAVVAEVRGRLILLGVTEQSVRRLAWLDKLEDDDQAQDNCGREHSQLEDATKPRRSRPSSNAQPPRHSGLGGVKFSDVLRDAVGMRPKNVEPPAVALATATHDRLTLRNAKDNTFRPVELMNIEGQAAGLVARLNRKQ